MSSPRSRFLDDVFSKKSFLGWCLLQETIFGQLFSPKSYFWGCCLLQQNLFGCLLEHNPTSHHQIGPGAQEKTKLLHARKARIAAHAHALRRYRVSRAAPDCTKTMKLLQPHSCTLSSSQAKPHRSNSVCTSVQGGKLLRTPS